MANASDGIVMNRHPAMAAPAAGFIFLYLILSVLFLPSVPAYFVREPVLAVMISAICVLGVVLPLAWLCTMLLARVYVDSRGVAITRRLPRQQELRPWRRYAPLYTLRG